MSGVGPRRGEEFRESRREGVGFVELESVGDELPGRGSLVLGRRIACEWVLKGSSTGFDVLAMA